MLGVMASDLTFGSVPPLYREIYDLLCPNQDFEVDREMFIKLLVKSSLPSQTLSQIWDYVDSKQGLLTRSGLYKALALIALAQQGKQLNDKILESFSGQELPKPSLGELGDLKALGLKLRREKNPTRLGVTFADLQEMSSVSVELVPEKKGIFLKHVEYEVRSERYKVMVRRRYNDFIALHELLLSHYPYRMIPRLPPKKLMGGDSSFIEERRRALKRFLTLVCRHPVLSDDQVVKFFFTYSGSDMQYKIRENYRNIPDEFVTSDLASKAKDLVPLDSQQQYAVNRDYIKQIFGSITHLKEIFDRMVIRNQAHSSDLHDLGKELSTLAVDRVDSPWASGSSEAWFYLKKGLKCLSTNFATISEKVNELASKEEEGVSEKINLFLDLLASYKDLSERHEKGVIQDHQRALSKIMVMKKKINQSVKAPESLEEWESRITEQENQILNVENRNYYSLHCIRMETQLVHVNMESLREIIINLVKIQTCGHSELSKVWEQLYPAIENLLPECKKSPNNSRPTSPINETAPNYPSR